VFVFTLSLPVLSLTLRRSSHPFSARLFQCVTTPDDDPLQAALDPMAFEQRAASGHDRPPFALECDLRSGEDQREERDDATEDDRKKGQSGSGTFRVTGSTIAPSVVVSLVCISWPITSPFGTADQLEEVVISSLGCRPPAARRGRALPARF
jgi:hypothetical protein